MRSLVKGLMTTPVVTVEPTTPFKEIVARLAQHRISAVGRSGPGWSGRRQPPRWLATS